MKAIELLLSDSRGIYIPMTFAQDCLGYPSDSENGWEFSENCAEVLLRGGFTARPRGQRRILGCVECHARPGNLQARGRHVASVSGR